MRDIIFWIVLCKTIALGQTSWCTPFLFLGYGMLIPDGVGRFPFPQPILDTMRRAVGCFLDSTRINETSRCIILLEQVASPYLPSLLHGRKRVYSRWVAGGKAMCVVLGNRPGSSLPLVLRPLLHRRNNLLTSCNRGSIRLSDVPPKRTPQIPSAPPQNENPPFPTFSSSLESRSSAGACFPSGYLLRTAERPRQVSEGGSFWRKYPLRG